VVSASHVDTGPGTLVDDPAHPAEHSDVAGGEPTVPGADTWTYGAFSHDDAGKTRTITLIHQSGFEARFRVPDFVNQGAEIGDLARLITAAWERQEALKGSGG
jgi:hypothetical protein